MTTPIPAPEDLVAGCVRRLRADPALTAAVGADSGGAPLIVQDQAPDRAEFTSTVCVVVSHGGYAAGNSGSFQSVRLQLEFWSDPARDSGGLVDEAPAGARQRMVAAYLAADRLLHRVGGGEQQWGAELTVDSERMSGLVPYLVPGSDGLWRGTAFYAATTA